MPRKAVDETGNHYGRLTVVARDASASSRSARWFCRCDCGTVKSVSGTGLRMGGHKSCGCGKHVKQPGSGRKRLPGDEAARRTVVQAYRQAARERGIPFSLSVEEVRELIAAPCTYCGAPPSNVGKGKHGIGEPCVYSGIDRVDNTKGYIAGNVVTCCRTCNRAKHAMPLADWLAYLNQLVSFRTEGCGWRVAT